MSRNEGGTVLPPIQLGEQRYAGVVVIVDEDPALLRSLQRLFSARALCVGTFTDADTALRWLSHGGTADVVIVGDVAGRADLMRAVGTALERALRIVYTSGEVPTEGCEHVHKPATPGLLMQRLRAHSHREEAFGEPLSGEAAPNSC